MSETDIFGFLEQVGITYDRFDHPPVYTCEEANKLLPDISGDSTKNLFVRDRKGKRHFLIVVPDRKSVDLLAIQNDLECTRLSMGSPERLKRCLDIEPGAVSLLAISNDSEGAVELVIDTELWNADAIQCHPLVNTSTLVVPLEGVKRLLRKTGHTPLIIDVPQK